MMIYNINISLYALAYGSTDSSYGHHESQLAHVTFCISETELKKNYTNVWNICAYTNVSELLQKIPYAGLSYWKLCQVSG